MLRRLLTAAVAACSLVVAVGLPVASAAAAATAARPDPVLLVHGFQGSASGWGAMTEYLRAHGYRSAEIDAVDYDRGASNVDIAKAIAREVAKLRARTGAAHVDVVSHSMGAISSRYYVERMGGAANVDAWVSLAGVNEGTVWAYGCYALTQCREMVPSSSMLQRLHESFTPAGTTRFGAWWSPCDDVIVPRANAALPGARNVETACLGHSDLKADPVVLEQVTRFLAQSAVGG